MIEGRPRESLVQFENPIEVSYKFAMSSYNMIFRQYRFQVAIHMVRRVSVSNRISLFLQRMPCQQELRPNLKFKLSHLYVMT